MIGKKEGLTVEQLIDLVKADAIEYAVENGLKGKLRASITVNEFGFKVEVSSDNGTSACCSYRRDGIRSMYELTKGAKGMAYGC